jgi:hypothetical protein
VQTEDLESAIQQLRAHVEAAIERESPRPVIEALSATIEELEARLRTRKPAEAGSLDACLG